MFIQWATILELPPVFIGNTSLFVAVDQGECQHVLLSTVR